MGAPAGNQYAKRPTRRDTQITIRISSRLKSQFQEHCESIGTSLSDWLIRLAKTDLNIKDDEGEN